MTKKAAALHRRFPVGAAVTVHPVGLTSTWEGEVAEHPLWSDGDPRGVTNVRCTDPRGFWNQRPGQITSVETTTLRLHEQAQPPAPDLFSDAETT